MGYNLWMPSRKETSMTTKFDDFIREVEDNSTDEERRELDAARARFRIGARLLQQRQAAGLSQQQLATVSGIAQADISRIERGQINPTAATLQTLGAPLGVTLDYVPSPELVDA
jgi:ribosome-binding protein aMBF1 (putative translation factor)